MENRDNPINYLTLGSKIPLWIGHAAICINKISLKILLYIGIKNKERRPKCWFKGKVERWLGRKTRIKRERELEGLWIAKTNLDT